MNEAKKILVVEDDASIRNGLIDAIEADGYQVSYAATGPDALDLYANNEFHLVVLDVMLPGVNGYDICRKIRETNKFIPILMLTAKSEEIDKVLGLELGADDYITKPFGIREVLARIHVALRRMENQMPVQPVAAKGIFSFGGVEVDKKRFLILRNGEELSLTSRELKLLEVFAARPDEVLSRDFLLDAVWGIEYMGTTRTLDQHIAQLRKKVETGDVPAILTVHGVGYRFSGVSPSGKIG